MQLLLGGGCRIHFGTVVHNLDDSYIASLVARPLPVSHSCGKK